MPDFANPQKETEKWYDLYEDWTLIESSFSAQYAIRLRNEHDMSWDEFTSLLAGILPETPLGYIVSIRSENDREKLKNFTTEQKRIRSAWRSRRAKQYQFNPLEAAKAVAEFEKMIARAFG